MRTFRMHASALMTHMLWFIVKSGYITDMWQEKGQAREGEKKEDVEVSGFLRAPLTGQATKSLLLLFLSLPNNSLSQTASRL